ncbi:MAG: PAS domain S-box protein [Chitinophagaceae bacterium]|nr:PAS domain S-box protein [Chitinophagaceae bacterium]MBL0130025.1 PAS domain S-box protein [Chitinophagaceae bacterium]MBL0273541.1 PAS domain S-box protein [Chitinophagaceae bacterium]
MKRRWSTLKQIISAYEQHHDIFLSLINEEGRIICANATMVKALRLQNPRQAETNIFELLHPVNLSDFKTAIRTSAEKKSSYGIELYLRNGYYHPMKWEINYLQPEKGQNKNYLCVGHRIPEEERIKKFNQLGEKNFQMILEGLNAGVFFQDRNGELIAANQKAAEIFNTTLERLYQLKNFGDLWNTDLEIKNENGNPVTFAGTPFMKALQTGETQTEVLVIRLRNGAYRYLGFSSQPMFEENSTMPFAVVSNITDVTREKKLSEQLQEREALFNVFMKQTPYLAWVVDEDSNLVFASQSFYQYFGLDERASLNKNIIDLVPDGVAKALYEKHLQVLKTGVPAELLKKVKWANGADFFFHINIFPIEGVTRKKMLGGHAVNLADKFAAEKKLKEANDRVLLLSRATSDAIWEWDMQTAHIFRNDALMDLIGYQREDTKGLSWWLRRIHPEDRNRVSDKVKDTTEKNLHSWEDEYRFKCADGNYKHMHYKGYVVYENGLPVKMIGSLQDVSGMKELEDQLMDEKMERQKEISETVIRVQEKERARIGHELHDNVNQILSSAKLFVEMLSTTGKEEKEIKKKSLDYVMLAIEEIRKLSKELVVPQLNQNGLIESVETLIADIHLSTGIKIKFTHDHVNNLLTQGKNVTLFRIVQEQLKNILKHSKANQVEIHLQCNERDAQLIIKDNGIGFDPRQTHRGIGLSGIYERTRFYSGSVDIQTSPGQGCSLTVSIPCL